MIAVDVRFARGGFALDAAFEAGAGITALFGPSGSGKSTVLDLIAGLLRPSAGCIAFDGEVMADTGRRVFVPPHRRRAGYVFQDAQLFPHMSVRRNLAFGQRPRDEAKLRSIADLLAIAPLLGRNPATLSGGEKQRVAIGRALLSSPRVLLMDEPLAALDMGLRREIVPYIEALPRQFGIPIIYVSHDMGEVARLADRAVLLEGGRVAARGTPRDVLRLTAGDRFSQVSVLTAHWAGHDARYDLTALAHPSGALTVAGHIERRQGGVHVLVRATDVTLAIVEPQGLSSRTALKGTVASLGRDPGPVILADIALEGGDRLGAAITRKSADELDLQPGRAVWCLVKAVSIDERLMSAP